MTLPIRLGTHAIMKVESGQSTALEKIEMIAVAMIVRRCDGPLVYTTLQSILLYKPGFPFRDGITRYILSGCILSEPKAVEVILSGVDDF